VSLPEGTLAVPFTAAFNARDVAAMSALSTDDVEIRPLRSVLEDAVYRGPEGIGQWMAELDESWSELRLELDLVETHPAGIEFARGRIVGSGSESRATTEATGYWIAWIDEGGLLTRLVTFTDEAAARAALDEALTAPEVMQGVFTAFMSMDVRSLDAWRALANDWWDEDIEMVEDPRWPGAGEFHGREQVVARFHEYFQQLDDGDVQLLAVHGSGSERVLELMMRARGSGSGAPVEQLWGWRVRLVNGRLAAIRAYLDVQEALATLG
jgi:ketosteroid isomerase-like protein